MAHGRTHPSAITYCRGSTGAHYFSNKLSFTYANSGPTTNASAATHGNGGSRTPSHSYARTHGDSRAYPRTYRDGDAYS